MPGNESDDLLLVKAIAHEFTRAKLAFFYFLDLSEKKSIKPEQYDNSRTLFLLYNAYGLFIHHLYEYQKGCFKREFRKYREDKINKIDELITNELDKFLRNCVILIEHNKAPAWIDSHRKTFYEKGAPADFGKDFREVRNYLAHVDLERIRGESRLSLSEFYLKLWNRINRYI
ncbi:hypothetical protein [Natranaerofaba carboxydovora]|uniref:hypothetical protein n=1 Tax=Natranaerofaba carboxydovora TaxID=2742683 RepID=UPI001F138995|nr:hypothetical protein [Natranaerofaba carboxydovora]UMZ72812.1 hypothetical protein ACONDI_00342 [Natranaerofaba carboxydovora]